MMFCCVCVLFYSCLSGKDKGFEKYIPGLTDIIIGIIVVMENETTFFN